jgi:hypothetical protein
VDVGQLDLIHTLDQTEVLDASAWALDPDEIEVGLDLAHRDGQRTSLAVMARGAEMPERVVVLDDVGREHRPVEPELRELAGVFILCPDALDGSFAAPLEFPLQEGG